MTEFSFDGAVAVVTGGAGGIGRALAARLAAEGARVAIVDLDSRAGEMVAAGRRRAPSRTADVEATGRRAQDGGRGRERPRPDRHLLLQRWHGLGWGTRRGGEQGPAGGFTPWPHSRQGRRPRWATDNGQGTRDHGVRGGLLMMMQSAPYTVTTRRGGHRGMVGGQRRRRGGPSSTASAPKASAPRSVSSDPEERLRWLRAGPSSSPPK